MSRQPQPMQPAEDDSDTDFLYQAVGGDSSQRVGWPTVTLALVFGVAVGGVVSYSAFRQVQRETLPPVVTHVERQLRPPWDGATPQPCAEWERRCLLGAAAAREQRLGRFWPNSSCTETPARGVAVGRMSCANRAEAWQSPSLAQSPSPGAPHAADGAHVTDGLHSETLFLFLPGTGTSTAAVRSLLDAASEMGYHVLGLSYASLPTAVSMSNIWCTRPGADAARCNAEMHDSVLFGSRSTISGASSLWDVPRNESVAALVADALEKLGWSQFLHTAGKTSSVRWDRIVVSGHSQGASHAAYLSTAVAVRAAILFSGPQEVPACSSGWLRKGPPTLRRAAYAMREECGDKPAINTSYCAAFPRLLERNLEAMGMDRGDVGMAQSGYVVLDFEPLIAEGRSFHDSVALQAKAPPPTAAMWKALLGLEEPAVPAASRGTS